MCSALGVLSWLESRHRNVLNEWMDESFHSLYRGLEGQINILQETRTTPVFNIPLLLGLCFRQQTYLCSLWGPFY